MSQPPPVTRDGAQHGAQHELSKAIYHRNSDPLPVRAVKWVGHLIDRALNSALDHSPAGNLGALAIVVIVGIAIAVVIWRVGVPRRMPTAGAVLAAGRSTTAADHRGLSEAAASRDEWPTAVLERMRAIARELEERGILDPRAGRTATELAAESGRLLPHASGSLRSAADTFNAVVYGGRDASRADCDVLVAADNVIRQTKHTLVMAT